MWYLILSSHLLVFALVVTGKSIPLHASSYKNKVISRNDYCKIISPTLRDFGYRHSRLCKSRTIFLQPEEICRYGPFWSIRILKWKLVKGYIGLRVISIHGCAIVYCLLISLLGLRVIKMRTFSFFGFLTPSRGAILLFTILL